MEYRLEGHSADGFDDEIEVVEVKEVNEMLDDIEKKLRMAIELIDGLNGIESVDKCRNILNEIVFDIDLFY